MAKIDDDPYLGWVSGADPDYLKRPERTKQPGIPILIELVDGKTASEFWALAERPESAPFLEVPKVYGRLAALKAAKFCTASVKEKFFGDPAGTPGLGELHRSIRRFEAGLPGLGALTKFLEPEVTARPSQGARVITAVMDDGLAFAHRRFRRADGKTRVEFLWDQGKDQVLAAGGEKGIDERLSDCKHAGVVDEDEVYRKLRHEDYLASGHKTLGRRRAHGTHAMDLACGADPGSADDRLVVGVQFPTTAVRDTSGAWLTPHVLLGLWFILAAAEKIAASGAGQLPIIVNVSYGKFADSHDGKSLLESAIDDLVDLWTNNVARLAVVLPSGNCHLARCHARFSLAPGAEQKLHWRVLPDDRTPSFLEIWPVPSAGVAPGLKVTLVPPAPGQALTVTRGQSARWPAAPDRPLSRADYQAAGLSLHRDRIVIAIAPTVTEDSARVAPAGIWEVRVESQEQSRSADVEAWIQRDDTPYGWPIAGRQSRFDDPKYVRFDPSGRYVRSQAAGRELAVDNAASYVKRAGSINAIATGDRTVVVGAFRSSDRAAAAYSAGGPLGPGGKREGVDPDVMAVGDDSTYCGGVLAAGTRSGSVVAMRGTSVAAPQITRLIADEMASTPSAALAVEAPKPARRLVHDFAAAHALPGAQSIVPERKGVGLLEVRKRLGLRRDGRNRRLVVPVTEPE
jgi:hypothetical protein